MEVLQAPWPWYVAGPLIGLTVPLLLLMGNKKLGISSTLRQICAACVPGRIPLFQYEWKKEIWNLYFVGGVLLGGVLGGVVLANPEPVAISSSTIGYIAQFSIPHEPGLMPASLFAWQELATVKGWLLMVLGGFLVGFGTRYARGCTSGHGITGLSSLQWPSLIATCCFFLGGILFSRFVLPLILSL
jgi:uncharacterized membrane protein YedE/YeeE